MPAAASPRHSTVGRRAVLGAAAVTVVGACTGGHPRTQSGIAAAPRANGAGYPLVVGVVAPLTGPYAHVGLAARAAVTAAGRHIDVDLAGSLGGYRPVVITADAPLVAADGRRAYAQLKAAHVDAVLWCGAPGLAETVPSIVADLTPVLAIGSDLQSLGASDPAVPDMTTADAAGFPVFQLGPPLADAFDVLAAYAAGDRGLVRSAVVWTSSALGADAAWAVACADHGIEVGVSPSFDASTGPPDMTAVAKALQAARTQFVVVVGGAPDAASLVAALDALGARYVDTPSILSGEFRPMVAGIAPATGVTTLAALAGGHVAKGTIAAATLGAATGLPQLPVRDWLARFVSGYGLPRGGEDGPADALAALLTAAGAARSTAGADLVAALETARAAAFATPVPIGFTPDRHVAPRPGDVALLTLESLPELRYNLGKEWGPIYPAGDRTPDLLIDPTLTANRAAHPDLIGQILAQGYGISSQAAYQGADPSRMAACRAVH